MSECSEMEDDPKAYDKTDQEIEEELGEDGWIDCGYDPPDLEHYWKEWRNKKK